MSKHSLNKHDEACTAAANITSYIFGHARKREIKRQRKRQREFPMRQINIRLAFELMHEFIAHIYI